MHTVSYEFFIKPEESANCHQTLSTRVGSGHETNKGECSSSCRPKSGRLAYPSLVLCVQARNLVYMVQRRERQKKQLTRTMADVFELESRLLEEEMEEEEREEEEKREEEERERLENELSFRQTRWKN